MDIKPYGPTTRHAETFSYLPPMTFDTAILWGTIFFAYSGAEAVAFLRNEIEMA